MTNRIDSSSKEKENERTIQSSTHDQMENFARSSFLRSLSARQRERERGKTLSQSIASHLYHKDIYTIVFSLDDHSLEYKTSSRTFSPLYVKNICVSEKRKRNTDIMTNILS